LGDGLRFASQQVPIGQGTRYSLQDRPGIMWKQALDRAFDQYKRLREEGCHRGTRLRGGFDRLNQTTGGLARGTLTVLGGRPGMGKTTFLLNLARKFMESEHPTGFITLESTVTDLAMHFLQHYSGVRPCRSEGSEATEDDLEALEMARSSLAELPFYPFYVGDLGHDIHGITELCSRAVSLHGVEVLMIDSLWPLTDPDRQLFRGGKRAGLILQRLKLFARQYNVAVVVASPLGTRAIKRDAKKRPSMADLPAPKTVSNSADDVLLLYRPYYYGIIEDEAGNPTENRTHLIVAKSKAGPPAEIFFRYHPERSELEEMEG